MNKNSIFFTPFTTVQYEEDQIIINSTGINPFETPFKPMKYDDY